MTNTYLKGDFYIVNKCPIKDGKDKTYFQEWMKNKTHTHIILQYHEDNFARFDPKPANWVLLQESSWSISDLLVFLMAIVDILW